MKNITHIILTLASFFSTVSKSSAPGNIEPVKSKIPRVPHPAEIKGGSRSYPPGE